MQLKDAQKNYPVHKKELLVIVCALRKWCSGLLGSLILVYTDHQTLEIFETQKDLSQFDMTIIYIWGEDNTVMDALSCLPDHCNEINEMDDIDMSDPPGHWDLWLKQATVNTIMNIAADESFLR